MCGWHQRSNIQGSWILFPSFSPRLCWERIYCIPSAQKVGSSVGVYKASLWVLSKGISKSLCHLWIIAKFCGWHINSVMLKLHYCVCIFNTFWLIYCCKENWKLIKTGKSRLYRAASPCFWTPVLFVAMCKPLPQSKFHLPDTASLAQHVHSALHSQGSAHVFPKAVAAPGSPRWPPHTLFCVLPFQRLRVQARPAGPGCRQPREDSKAFLEAADIPESGHPSESLWFSQQIRW